jgi:two-component system response regulator YesN
MWRVVIIDDDHKVLRGMKKVIPWKSLQCEWVGEAHNGEEGIKIILDKKPDIIITDIYMPVMNGLEMIQELKEYSLDHKVIILSGFNDFEYARQAMRLKIADYLSKPASIDTITDVLKSVINQLQEEAVEKKQVVELKKKMTLYEPLVEKEWIKSVVTGITNVWQVPSRLNSLLERWQEKEHVALAITYDEPLEHTSFYHSDWSLFRFACSNIISEISTSYFDDVQYIEIHIFQGALCIHFEKIQYNVMEKLKELSKSVEESLNTYLQIKATVSIGSIKNKWEELAASMKDALTASRAETVSEELESLGVHAKSTSKVWSEAIETSQKLSEAIRYADEKSAFEIIDVFFTRLQDLEYTKPVAVRVGIEMWTVMTYSLHDVGFKIQEMMPENNDLLYELSLCKNWIEIKTYIKTKITLICHHQQWDENLKHRQLVEQIIEYVNEHIAENITLQDIANDLYISRNYLGQIFKNIVGESFKNYLTRVRMERAKKMIQDGHFLIYEISEKVGYVNPAYFTTTFKKYTGYTPTELIHKKSVNQ